MSARAACRYALFLVLIFSGQESSFARYNPDERLLAETQDTGPIESMLDDVFNYNNGKKKQVVDLLDQDNNRIMRKDDNEEDDERGLQVAQPQKRFISFNVAVLATQMAFSAASLGAEIWYKIHGCCKSHSLVCKYRDEIKDLEYVLGNLSVKTDAMAAEAFTLKEYVLQTSSELDSVWKAMQDIQTYEEELIEVIQPGVRAEFEIKYREIETALSKNNVTVQHYTYDQLNREYESFFDSFGGAAAGLSPWLGYGGMFLAKKAFNMYKTRQINNVIDAFTGTEGYKQLVNARHTRAARVLGIDKVGLNNYIKEYATNKVNAKFTGKKMTYAVRGLSVAALGLSAAFDILSILAKVEQCDEVESKLKTSRDEMIDVEADIRELLSNITEYKNFLYDEGWLLITTQVTNSSFQVAVEDIKELVVNADNKTPALEDGIVYMQDFLSQINETSTSNSTNSTYSLVKHLATSLQAVKFKMSCYVNRARLIKHLIGQCKNGTNNLPDLYNEGIKTFGTHGDFCFIDDQGTPYTSYSGVEETVKNVSSAEKFNSDCILNNGDKKTTACGHSRDGHPEAEIAGMMSLTVEQVQYFLANCPFYLTPNQEKQICKCKVLEWTAKETADFLEGGLTEEIVQNYMDTKCP